jgi:hypothetical protein
MAYTVEVRTGILTESTNLHTWLHITKPDGTSEAWGFYPETDSFGNIIYGAGDVRQESPTSDADYTATSGPLYLTDYQYQALMDHIAAQDANPPNYSIFSLPGGIQCSMWAIQTLHEIDPVPWMISPSITPELIPISEEAAALPGMNGSGRVCNLKEAASLSPEFAGLLAQYAAAGTQTQQTALLDRFLGAWSGTSAMATTATGAYDGHPLTIGFQGITAGTAAHQAWLDKLTVLERFTGQTFRPVSDGTGAVIRDVSFSQNKKRTQAANDCWRSAA